MHGPAGVVEILVQIQGEYPYSEIQNTAPPPKNENCQSPSPSIEYPLKMKIVRESKSESFRIPPPK